MNLYLRLFRVLILSLWRARVFPEDEVTTHFRVWPHDVDVFGHMNKGRYLQIMDAWFQSCLDARTADVLRAAISRASAMTSAWGRGRRDLEPAQLPLRARWEVVKCPSGISGSRVRSTKIASVVPRPRPFVTTILRGRT